MSALGEGLRRVWYLLNRRRFDRALAEEMEAHRGASVDPAISSCNEPCSENRTTSGSPRGPARCRLVDAKACDAA